MNSLWVLRLISIPKFKPATWSSSVKSWATSSHAAAWTSRGMARSSVTFPPRASASRTAPTSRAASKSTRPRHKPPPFSYRRRPCPSLAWASFFELNGSTSRVPLLVPRIALGVVAVALPESQSVFAQQHEPAPPLHAFPCVEMRHDQPHRPAVFRRQRLAVVLKREQHIRPQQIRQRDIRRVTFLRHHQRKLRLRLPLDHLHHIRKQHALPPIVQPAPARHAMKIRSHLRLRQRSKFFPAQPHRLFQQSRNLEVPLGRIKTRHTPVIHHRPFQRQRLPRRQPPLGLRLVLQFPPPAVPKQCHHHLPLN